MPVQLSDVPGFHILAVLCNHFFRRAGIDDDAVGQAVGVAAAAVLQEQVDAGPHDDRAGRAVEWERHKNAGDRVLFQIARRLAAVRHDHHHLGDTARFYIVYFKVDQSVFRLPTLGRSLLGADIETAHADELMLAGVQRDGVTRTAIAKASHARLILVPCAIPIAVPLVGRGIFLVAVDAVDIGVALALRRASVGPQQLAMVARGGVLRVGIPRAEVCRAGGGQMLRDDDGIGGRDRAIAVEVQRHELRVRQLAAACTVVGDVDDD
ncbi:MAG: hypothetical protein O3C40_14565 [Planctomycetota bacterium]|nr:hypothetical protein [Planctomycetota bacterium]